jgi:hypothetical protein
VRIRIVVIANSIKGADIVLDDIEIEGIENVTADQLIAENTAGNTISVGMSGMAVSGVYPYSGGYAWFNYNYAADGFSIDIEYYEDFVLITAETLNAQNGGPPAPTPPVRLDMGYGGNGSTWLQYVAANDGNLSAAAIARLRDAFLQNQIGYIDPDPYCGIPDIVEIDSTQRDALVYNFEDDNFTWMQASVDQGNQLIPVVCMQYEFNPGWQARWSDLQTANNSWDDLQNGVDQWGDGSTPTKWSDFYYAGTDENMYWLTYTGVYRSDQLVKTDGMKEYFVERESIDLDDVNPAWTTNKFKHMRQFFFHLQSPTPVSETANMFGITFGWSLNLMDQPDWLEEGFVNLQTTANSGKYKYDFRSTGRYLAMRMTFNGTAEIKMTGGDMDVEESYGR